MTIADVKESLHDLIDRIEDQELLYAYLKIVEKGLSTPTDPIVGYTPQGDVITRSKLVHRARSASERVKSGHYTTQEDLEKESENW